MDWVVIGAIAIAGWMMLSVLTGERFSRAQYMAIALAQQAKAKAEEITIARVSEPGSAAAQPSKKR